jgi:WW domain-containing oxidoreductase
VGKYSKTKDGLESHFQVNHLSQFLLLMKLLSRLQRTPGARVVFESSDMHKLPDAGSTFETEEEINHDIGSAKLYNRSKLAQVLTARALQRRVENGQLGFSPSQRIFINAVHPGAVATDQPLQAEEAYGTMGKIGHRLIRPFMKDPDWEGCRPALYAVTSPEIEERGVSGEYIVPDKKVTSPTNKAQDEQLGEQLWQLSEELLRSRLGQGVHQL